MMLSKKYYKAIAEIIADRFVDIADNTIGFAVRNNIDIIARKLADYFAADNPRCEKTNTGFDRDRFMKACGLQTKSKAYACESCSQIKVGVKWREETEQYECQECYKLWQDENGL